MREVPIPCGFLAFPAITTAPSRFRTVSDTLSRFISGLEALSIIRRDKNATWGTLGAVCRERGWPKSRAVYELQNGLPYRTFPPGHVIDWHNPLTHGLSTETGEVMLVRGVLEVEGTLSLEHSHGQH